MSYTRILFEYGMTFKQTGGNPSATPPVPPTYEPEIKNIIWQYPKDIADWFNMTPFTGTITVPTTTAPPKQSKVESFKRIIRKGVGTGITTAEIDVQEHYRTAGKRKGANKKHSVAFLIQTSGTIPPELLRKDGTPREISFTFPTFFTMSMILGVCSGLFANTTAERKPLWIRNWRGVKHAVAYGMTKSSFPPGAPYAIVVSSPLTTQTEAAKGGTSRGVQEIKEK